ncbi:MAG: fimbrillin family protein, partial [Muribaculaceae bacterium]|nr:fimbrillin family protein [Muribaculaceae bacterium]
MNITINKIHILLCFAALIGCSMAVSCSQDELGIDTGTPLPAGKYPLEFTASVDGMTTRATSGKDAWTINDEIGVRIGNGETGRYKITKTNGTSLEAVEPVYWLSDARATVTGWYPYEEQTNVSITDQSGLSDFKSIDFLTASDDYKFDDKVSLTFKHQMAKVRCVLKSADTDDISSKEVSQATVTFNGCTEASFAEGVLTGSAFGEIVPVKSNYTHEALLVPADMTGKELFRVNINVGGYDKSFSYTPSDSYAKLKPGTSYV